MLSSVLIIVAAFSVGCLASPAPVEPYVDYGNANLVTDIVMKRINEQLPDNISITTLPPGMENRFDAHNCFFIGLENGVRREGDATVVITDDIARYVFALKLQQIGITCDFKVEIDNGHGEGKTELIVIDTGILIQMVSGQHPYLTDFRVSEIAPVVVDVSGFFLINWAIQDVANWIAANIDEALTYVIENQLKEVIQSILDGLIVP